MNLSTRLRRLLMLLTLAPLAAWAQTVPNSGRLLQQVHPHESTQTVHKPKLRVDQPKSRAAQSNTPFRVDHIVITGATEFTAAALHTLVASGEGQTLTLAKLQALAGRISAYYHAHGYLLARAVVPAQTLDHGTVHLKVIEARYDRVRVTNTSRVSDALVRSTLAPMQPGQVVTRASLDRALLLLGDLPGVAPHAVLRPGRAVGTTEVDVSAAAMPFVNGDAYLDNAGNRYTGRARIGADLNLNDPLHHGDLLSLGVVTAGNGLSFGRLTYQYTLNGVGTRVGVGYSALSYALAGDSVSALDAHGTARAASAWLVQPLLRGRDTRLDVRVQFDRKQLRDAIGAADIHDDRHIDSWTVQLFGQHRDAVWGGGLTRGGVSIHRGKLDFDNAAAAASDATTARTQGNFTRWDAHLSRLQYLGTAWQLYAGVRGQGSADNLDSSAQFLLGGPDSVRGYASGTAAGSNGWMTTLALRHDMACGAGARCQGRLFVDSGALRVNADPWTAARNHARLSSAGIGFHWIGDHQWLVRIQAAVPIGSNPDDAHHDAQFWAQVSKGF